MATSTPFISIGSRGTAILTELRSLPSGIVLGIQDYQPNRPKWTARDKVLEAWVMKPKDKLTVLALDDALKKAVLRSVPVHWEYNGKSYEGLAFLKASWTPGDEWPTYVAVQCAEWPHGVVETNANKTNAWRFVGKTLVTKAIEPNYWMTTHWPRWVDMPMSEPHEGVFVADGNEHVIAEMRAGDLVFIYECKEGRTKTVKTLSGEVERIPCGEGKEGVVALVEVCSPPKEILNSQPHNYTDGTTVWWRYKADTKPINSMGFIPRKGVCKTLGYSEDYVLTGFGDYHSGVKKITKEKFEELNSLYVASADQKEAASIETFKRHGYGGGGEGPVHLALKNRIAQNPSALLSELGLVHYETELPFATNDRVDIVLKDKFGRFVAVEVEVDCDASEEAGPLQCMKYRAMLSYVFGIPVEEVRTLLVAHSIHADLKERCKRHGIETIVVPRS